MPLALRSVIAALAVHSTLALAAGTEPPAKAANSGATPAAKEAEKAAAPKADRDGKLCTLSTAKSASGAAAKLPRECLPQSK